MQEAVVDAAECSQGEMTSAAQSAEHGALGPHGRGGVGIVEHSDDLACLGVIGPHFHGDGPLPRSREKTWQRKGMQSLPFAREGAIGR